MNYELAKELTDAGFPQDIKVGDKYYSEIGHPRLGIPHQQAENISFVDHTDIINKLCSDGFTKIPTIEELIDACGEKEFTLKRIHDNKLGWIWKVYGWTTKDAIEQITSTGKTPTEAVAKLWLVLNKKS